MIKLNACLVAILLGVGLAFLGAAPAQAHPGNHLVATFADAFVHPFQGVDHLLAVLAVGIVAFLKGGRALLAIPVSFLVLMSAGIFIAISGVKLPHAELAWAASLFALPILLWKSRLFSSLALCLALASTGLGHGYLHGIDWVLPFNPISISGMLVGTASLYGLGLALALAVRSLHAEISAAATYR